MLDQEFKYYLDHQNELVEKYNSKFLVIKDKEVIGFYNDERYAYFDTQIKHKLGTFLIQYCSPGNDSYTRCISRVSFNEH